MKNEEKRFLILLLLVVLMMVAVSFRYEAGSRTLPMISGICTALIIGFLVVISFSEPLAAWYQNFEAQTVMSEESLKPEEKKREVSVITWFIGATALIYLVGFTVGILVFLFLFLKIWAKESWMLSVSVPVVVAAVIYVCFVSILRVPLHNGVFFM